MFKKQNVTKQDDIGGDWRDWLVVLWEEDDAPVPDKERVYEAFCRISEIKHQQHPIYVIDEGDQFINFYRGGWVKAVSCEGGWVGVLLKEKASKC